MTFNNYGSQLSDLDTAETGGIPRCLASVEETHPFHCLRRSVFGQHASDNSRSVCIFFAHHVTIDISLSDQAIADFCKIRIFFDLSHYVVHTFLYFILLQCIIYLLLPLRGK